MRLMVNVEGGLRAFMVSQTKAAAQGLRTGTELAAREGVLRFRAEVVGAGLGVRLANTVRSVVYPRPGVQTLSPATLIFSKAPRLISAFENAPTIRAVKGSKYLWIPTENVPRRSRVRMKPAEAEQLYGDFEFVPSIVSRGTFLAVVPALKSKTTGRFRRATEKRRQSGKGLQRIVMFVLVKFVTMRKRLDIARVERDLANDWPAIVARSLSAELEKAGDGA